MSFETKHNSFNRGVRAQEMMMAGNHELWILL